MKKNKGIRKSKQIRYLLIVKRAALILLHFEREKIKRKTEGKKKKNMEHVDSASAASV